MKCSECQYGKEVKHGWDCKISPHCVNDEDWNQCKCKSCVWGTWTGVGYKCALPRCVNGVDENG